MSTGKPILSKEKVGQKNQDNVRNAKDKKTGMKLSRLRKKRLIIRNLSFKVNEEQLKKMFSKFGEILEVKIPLKADGKKKGFAFVEFNDTKSMIKAMKKLNFQKIHGRPIAIDFAVNKDTYLSRLNSSTADNKRNSVKRDIKLEMETEDSDDDNITHSKENCLNQEIKLEEQINDSDDDSKYKEESQNKNKRTKSENDLKVKAFLKEFDLDDELNENSESDSSEDGDDDDDDEEEEEELKYSEEHNNHNSSNMGSKSFKKNQSSDIPEGKTVFIRNISFRNVEDELKDVLEEFGEVAYCLFCNDPITGHFKGTAFVKFKDKENAEKVIEESSKEPGIILDGRKLLCTAALSREELSKQRDGCEKNRDKRNLRLLKCGLIAYGSQESEGVSQTDMAKRAQLEAGKKQKLKNVNFFVSDTRLICHNIPKNINSKDLYNMFKKAGGEGAVIKEARIMKDFKKTDPQGNPMSKGFAFVQFMEHEHALKALYELNNNPNIFTASKRPIVEFSVENKVALLSQERRREKMKMLNKKRIEQSSNRNYKATDDQESPVNIKLGKQVLQKKRNSGFRDCLPYEMNSKKKKKYNLVNNSPDDEKVSPKKKLRKPVLLKKRNSGVRDGLSFETKSKERKKYNLVNNSPDDEKVSSKKKKTQKKSRKRQKQHTQTSEISALKQIYKDKLLNKFS